MKKLSRFFLSMLAVLAVATAVSSGNGQSDPSHDTGGNDYGIMN